MASECVNGTMKPVMRPRYLGNVIEIDLSRLGYHDYYVECLYRFDNSKDKYILSLYLCNRSMEDRMKISNKGIDTQYIHGTKETIVENICRVVHSLATVEDTDGSKFIDHYVEMYEYEMQCFDIGNEVMEKERMEDVNAGKE